MVDLTAMRERAILDTLLRNPEGASLNKLHRLPACVGTGHNALLRQLESMRHRRLVYRYYHVTFVRSYKRHWIYLHADHLDAYLKTKDLRPEVHHAELSGITKRIAQQILATPEATTYEDVCVAVPKYAMLSTSDERIVLNHLDTQFNITYDDLTSAFTEKGRTPMTTTSVKSAEDIRLEIARLSELADRLETQEKTSELVDSLKPLYLTLRDRHRTLEASLEKQIDEVHAVHLAISQLTAAIDQVERGA